MPIRQGGPFNGDYGELDTWQVNVLDCPTKGAVMEISTIVDWIQLGIWGIAALIYILKRAKTMSSDKWLGVLVSIGIIFSAFSLWLQYTNKPNGTRQVLVKDVLVAWGTNQPLQCQAHVDTAQLMAFREKYDVVVICGLIDVTVDRFKDRKITVSPRITIRRDIIPISFPTTKDMSEAIKAQVAQARREQNIP